MRAIGLLLLSCCFYAAAQAQEENAVAALRTELIGKQLFLKSFAFAEHVDYSWRVDHPEAPTSVLHGFTAFTPSKVELRADDLLITGVSRIVLMDAETHKLSLSSVQLQTTLKVHWADADSPSAFSSVRDSLFFKDAETGLAAIPEQLKPKVPAATDSHTHAISPCKICLEYMREDGVWRTLSSGEKGFKSPTLTKRGKIDPVPGLPRHVTATSSFAVTVDESGKVSDIWLCHPAGFGVDKAAEHAIRSLTYRPATYHDKPVATVSSNSITISD